MTACATCGRAICDHSDPEYAGVVTDLARAKAVFQQRAIAAAMGFGPTSIVSPVHNGADRTASDRNHA